MSGTLDGLSTSERDKELFSGAPNLGAAFKSSAGQDYGAIQREWAVQNRLLRSYTSTRDEVREQYEGMRYGKRKGLIKDELDQQSKEAGFVPEGGENLEQDTESLKNQVQLFRKLDLPNEKAAELRAGYEFVRNERLPVNSIDEIEAAKKGPHYSEAFIESIKDSYDNREHSLKSGGEIIYELSKLDEHNSPEAKELSLIERDRIVRANSLPTQFGEQFAALENPENLYVKEGENGLEYAQVITDEGHAAHHEDFGLGTTPITMKDGEARVVEDGLARWEYTEEVKAEIHSVNRNANGTPLVEPVAIEAKGISMPEAEQPSADLSDIKLPTPGSGGP